MGFNAVSGMFTSFKIVLSDDKKYCSPKCPQMRDGLCTKFGRTIEERENAKEHHPFSPQYESCKMGMKLVQEVYNFLQREG